MKRSKCAFMQKSVEYLGHRVDAEGIHASPEKVEAILKTPQPKNVQQMRSYLGLLNYYRKFLPNLASIIKPLNDLLHKDRKWRWTSECTDAFETAKQLLTTSPVLIHYDTSLPIKLAADASQYGLGAVISHVQPDGLENQLPSHPVPCQTVSGTTRYSQIDKEALALIFGVHKLHTYLYGRKFTLATDHKPLLSILGPKKGVSSVAAARLHRWTLLLSA